VITRRSLFTAGVAAGVSALALPVGAQSSSSGQANRWPQQRVRVIIPYPPGGLVDQVARPVADQLSQRLGQPFIIENKPGAGATLGPQEVARAKPDGYTLLIAPSAPIEIAPWLRDLSYSAEDFVPVARLASSFGLITTHKSAPFNTYKEFIDAAKKAPGKYTFASYGAGTSTHLTGVMLHKQAGIDLLHVPYKGSAPALIELLAGRVDMMYEPSTLPRIKEGALKGLATFPNAIPGLDVSTLKEQGLDFNIPRSWFGLLAPKDTPAEIVSILSKEIDQILKRPEIKEQWMVSALYPNYMDTAGFQELIKQENQDYGKIIKEENIKAD